MNGNLEQRLRPADIGWLAAAAATFVLFAGMVFMLLFGQTVLARAEHASMVVGVESNSVAFPPI